jgi:hypothetical protein
VRLAELRQRVEEDLTAFVRGQPVLDDRTLVLLRRLAG